jgi:hypothetical protein
MHDLWQHNFMTLVLKQLFLFLVDWHCTSC